MKQVAGQALSDTRRLCSRRLWIAAALVAFLGTTPCPLSAAEPTTDTSAVGEPRKPIKIGPERLGELPGLVHVEHLEIHEVDLSTDNRLELLKPLKNLVSLHLENCRVSPWELIRHELPFRKLEKLDVTQRTPSGADYKDPQPPPISKEEVARLTDYFPNLVSLKIHSLRRWQVSALRSLAALKHLENLVLVSGDGDDSLGLFEYRPEHQRFFGPLHADLKKLLKKQRTGYSTFPCQRSFWLSRSCVSWDETGIAAPNAKPPGIQRLLRLGCLIEKPRADNVLSRDYPPPYYVPGIKWCSICAITPAQEGPGHCPRLEKGMLKLLQEDQSINALYMDAFVDRLVYAPGPLIFDDGILADLRGLTQLEYLEIRSIDFASPRRMAYLAPLKNLRRLAFHYGDVKVRSVIKDMEAKESLTSLRIQENGFKAPAAGAARGPFSKEEIGALAKKFPNLKSIEIGTNETFDVAALEAFADFPALESLRIGRISSDTPRPTAEQTRLWESVCAAVKKKAPQIKKLGIEYSSVTPPDAEGEQREKPWR